MVEKIPIIETCWNDRSPKMANVNGIGKKRVKVVTQKQRFPKILTYD